MLKLVLLAGVPESVRSSENRNRLKQEFIQLLYMNIIQKTTDHEVDHQIAFNYLSKLKV